MSSRRTKPVKDLDWLMTGTELKARGFRYDMDAGITTLVRQSRGIRTVYRFDLDRKVYRYVKEEPYAIRGIRRVE